MLVIHNGTTMYPDNQDPLHVRPGSTVEAPNGNFVGPAANGVNLGDGWFLAEPLAADPVPDGFEGTEIVKNMVDGAPKFEHVLRQVTPEMALARRDAALKRECRNRIASIVNEETQNMLIFMDKGNMMDAADRTALAQLGAWMRQMVEARRALIASDADYTSNTEWPAVPAGVPELVAKY